MKINEITTNLTTYIATVRVVLRNGTTMAKTHVIADGITQARMMLTRWYGEGNVFSVQAVMDEGVTEGTKTLSPQELQVKSLADKAQQYKQQAKQTKARQQMAKAQQDLMTASRGASANEMRRDDYLI
jgi:hypothetical protein